MGQAADLHRKFFTAFEQGDLAALADLAHADVECSMPGGLVLDGLDQVTEMLRGYVAAFPNQKHTVVSVVEDADGAAVELRWEGTHEGTFVTPMGELPPTGNNIVIQSTDVVRVRDGKIASWHGYYDPTPMFIGIGAIPDPAAASV